MDSVGVGVEREQAYREEVVKRMNHSLNYRMILILLRGNRYKKAPETEALARRPGAD